MNHRCQLKTVLSIALLAATTISSSAFALENTFSTFKQSNDVIQNVQYDPHSGTLAIEGHLHHPLKFENLSHNARIRTIVFYIPDMIVQPDPRVLDVKTDPIVASVNLEQRAIKGNPAVRVKIDLYSNAPNVPVNLASSASGMILTFTRPDEESASRANPKTIASTQASASLKKTAVVQNANATPNFNNQFLAIKSLPQIEANPTSTMTKEESSPVSTPTLSQSNVTMIQDIYSEGNTLTVVSKNHPITVQRSFSLKAPNRYVLDISPAALSSEDLDRIVPVNHPGIFSFKAGQLNKDTVRLVIQFTKKPLPVTVSQRQDGRILKLAY